MQGRAHTLAVMRATRRLRVIELLPWLILIGTYFLLPSYLPLATQIIVMILFALSLDLLLGYTGVVTLGHAAYYGVGAYTAGILAVSHWSEPISGLLAATVMAGIVGLVTGYIILRTKGLTLLMLGMAVTLLLEALANHFNSITGGADGLQGIMMPPLLGRFEFALYGKVGYVYAAVVLFLAWLVCRRPSKARPSPTPVTTAPGSRAPLIAGPPPARGGSAPSPACPAAGRRRGRGRTPAPRRPGWSAAPGSAPSSA